MNMPLRFTMLQRKILIHILLILTLTACATTPPKAPEVQKKGDYTYLKDYMTWFIQKEMKDKDIVGLSIALVDDQRIVWQQGFGYADRENKIAAAPQTVYRAGSISKVFNAMAVMKLVEAGKMDIDQPLSTYLPEFTINSRFGSTDGITPRTIMTHHSGLPGDWIDGFFGKQPLPFTQLTSLIKDAYVAYPPNTIMSYSNLAVTLLGHAVQNVSGQEYTQFIDQCLLKPMGMIHSRYATGITDGMAAKSYKAGKVVTEYPLRDVPAGGLNTTVTDLARLAMLVNNHGMLENRQIIAPPTLETMFTVQNDAIPLDCGFKMGLAWVIDDQSLARKEPVYWHNGGTIAHCASFMVAPMSRLGVMVMANTNSAEPDKIAKKMLQTAWEAKTGMKLPEEKAPVQVDAPSDFKGTYASLIGKVDISPKSDHRYKVRSSMGNFNLNLEDDNRYHLGYRLLGFIPINLEELGEARLSTEDIIGHHVIIAELDQLRMLAGVRVEPQPIHGAWKNRLGAYQLLNPPETDIFKIKKIELKIEDGYLVRSVTDGENNTVTQILRTVNAKEAVSEGLGRGMGETIRIVEDGAEGEILTFSGLQFKRINE
jgi:CubicO group peptidase (beta-lactamase class C family)